jgi:hypothetical protein
LWAVDSAKQQSVSTSIRPSITLTLHKQQTSRDRAKFIVMMEANLIQRDILFALLGFSGDVIVSTNSVQSHQSVRWQDAASGSFAVKEGYPFLEAAARDQINRLVPLGWLYNRLQTYCQVHDLSSSTAQRAATGEGAGSAKELYRMALCAAIQDLLSEYVDDVTALETLVNQEDMQQLPLSHFQQYLQKVTTLSLSVCLSLSCVCLSVCLSLCRSVCLCCHLLTDQLTNPIESVLFDFSI